MHHRVGDDLNDLRWCAVWGLPLFGFLAVFSHAHAAQPPASVIVPFEASDAIKRFAEDAVHGVEGDQQRADRLYDALLNLRHQRRIIADADNMPKARVPKTARELFRVAQEEDGNGNGNSGLDRAAGCYEFTVLMVAAARSVGVPMVGVDRVSFTGTGQVGHVMAGLVVHHTSGSSANTGRESKHTQTLLLYDLQGQRRGLAWEDVDILDDAMLIAHHYNHLSVAAYLRGDRTEALRAIDVALDLAPRSAFFLNNRATILSAMGELATAELEVSHALSIAPNVPLYHYQLGSVRLRLGDLTGAVNALRAALALEPDYGLARRDLGWAYLLQGHDAQAELELKRVVARNQSSRQGHRNRNGDGLDHIPEGALYLGMLYLVRGQTAKAQQVVDAGLLQTPGDQSLRALNDVIHGDDKHAPRHQEVVRLRAVLAQVTSKRLHHDQHDNPDQK